MKKSKYLKLLKEVNQDIRKEKQHIRPMRNNILKRMEIQQLWSMLEYKEELKAFYKSI